LGIRTEIRKNLSRIPDQDEGGKKAPGPGFGFATLLPSLSNPTGMLQNGRGCLDEDRLQVIILDCEEGQIILRLVNSLLLCLCADKRYGTSIVASVLYPNPKTEYLLYESAGSGCTRLAGRSIKYLPKNCSRHIKTIFV
jgi:hypothetical protein